MPDNPDPPLWVDLDPDEIDDREDPAGPEYDATGYPW